MPHFASGPGHRTRPLLDVAVDVTHRVIQVWAELDRTTATVLAGSVERLRAARTGDVRIDLTELTFIGADGINTLVALQTLQQRDGQTLVVDPVPSRIERVFRLGHADWLLAA